MDLDKLFKDLHHLKAAAEETAWTVRMIRAKE